MVNTENIEVTEQQKIDEIKLLVKKGIYFDCTVSDYTQYLKIFRKGAFFTVSRSQRPKMYSYCLAKKRQLQGAKRKNVNAGQRSISIENKIFDRQEKHFPD